MAKDDDSLTSYLLKYADQKLAKGGAVQGYARGGDVTDEGLQKLFLDYFDRGADDDGLKYWKDTAAQNNLSLSDIGQQFAGSDEGREQYAKLEQSIGRQRATDATGAAPWKTWWGYTPTKKDYDMMLRAGLGEYGLTDDPNQVLGIYEAIGNRAAANNFLEKNAYAYDKTRPSGRFAKTIADQITEDEVEGAYATGRINSLLNSKDPAKMAIVQQARDQLLNYFTLGQNKVLGSQTDWRGFDPVTGEPSTGAAWRNYKGDAGRVVPGSEGLPMYNTFYNPKYRPDLQVKIANLQGQRNAIWGAPLPASRPSDTVLAQVQIFTDDDGRKSIFKDGVQTYIDEQEAATLQASNDAEAKDQTFTDENGRLFTKRDGIINYLDADAFETQTTVGGVQTANVGADNGDDYRYAFNPKVTLGADTGLGVGTYDPGSFKVYRNDAIDQNSIQQNLLNDSTRNWQQDFNNIGNGQFNMSNQALVGGYNSGNIGGFDYSGLGNSLGNVGATSGFGLNTGWDFGGGWGFAEGGEVNFKKMFEGDSEAMQERARELAREAYSKGYGSLGKKKAEEWENLARKYNLPLNVGPFDNYEDQYSNALSGWQRNVSPKQRMQTYDEGGPVKADLAVEELTNLQKILAGSNPAANVAPFQLDLGGGAQARGRVVQAGPYIDVGGGITLPLRDVMLMLDASYGKVPGTDMKPNISVKGGLRIPFSEGGPVMPSTDSMGAYDTMTGLVGELPAKPVYEPSPREQLEARMSDQARSAMDLSGLALPDRAVDVKADEFGSYPVDAEGNRLKYLRRSLLLPMVSGEDESRLAMPGFVEMAGNLMSGAAPAVKGSGAVLGSGPVRRGEKTLADLVDTYGVKKPGGNWIESSVDSKIDSLLEVPNTFDAREIASSEALNKWADSKLKGYIKNQFGTVADPLIDVAEVTGKLHIPDEQIERVAKYSKPSRGNTEPEGRTEIGYNPNLIGETDLSRNWEKLTQNLITRTKYKDLVYPETIPGMPVLPPESQVNKAVFINRELGFDHLADELKNAMNPNSGLPRNLQIEPDKLERFSMKQAVEHVIKINDWRAKNLAKANEAIAQNAATVPVKQYEIVPGTNYPNEKGLSWVELKPTDKDEKALEKALKYEGDTMGHCVGGYCPKVASGETQIFSLRDKKGEPHVTIEIEPGILSGHRSLESWVANYEKTHGPGTSKQFIQENPYIVEAFTPSITQIKGKANRAPKDEYANFVQDFIKSGNWQSVGDLRNAQMWKVERNQRLPGVSEPLQPGYYTFQELEKLAQDKGVSAPMIEDFIKKLRRN